MFSKEEQKLNLNKDLENAIAMAILSYFYKVKLLTPDEYARIKTTLNVGDSLVDISPNKSDVYR